MGQVLDPRLLADIQRAEGCSLTAYRDTRGNWTIGYGHLLSDPPQWTTISQAAANVLLATDVAARAVQAQSLPEWPSLDTPCRQNAVIECVFNLGLKNWHADFPGTRSAIISQDWPAAHDNLMQSPLWISIVGLGRVTRLAQYLLTGQYPASI